MTVLEPTAESLSTLLRLIDDETPEVRNSVAIALDAFEGDVSEILDATGWQGTDKEQETLSRLLLPARRRRLQREWLVPAAGARAFGEDWDGFESLLRMLSDFLHDGISLRQPLADALDLLAEEYEDAALEKGAPGLCAALLGKGLRLRSDPSADLDPDHLDLARVIDGGLSSSLGLGIIVLLVARRLELDISGINLPGAFFCRFQTESGPVLIDPSAAGREVDPADFAHRIRRYPREIRILAARPATPGELLVRVTEELATAFAVMGDVEDAELMELLVETLVGPS